MDVRQVKIIMFGELSDPLNLPGDFESSIDTAYKYFIDYIYNSENRPLLFDKKIFVEAREWVEEKPKGFWHVISLGENHSFKIMPCVNDPSINTCNQNCENDNRTVIISSGAELRKICLLRASRLPWILDIIKLANNNSPDVQIWLKDDDNHKNKKLYLRYNKYGADYLIIFSSENNYYRLISAFPVFYTKEKNELSADYAKYKWNYKRE